MEYQFKYDEVAKDLIFYQLHELDDSASVESYESIDENDRLHPDSAYFYFSFPIDGLKKRTGYYETPTMKIFLKEENNTFSVKIVKTNEYVFKLDLPEVTFIEVKQALENASVKSSGGNRKTRRKRIHKSRNNKFSPQNASHDT
jgi:hypothetical protein